MVGSLIRLAVAEAPAHQTTGADVEAVSRLARGADCAQPIHPAGFQTWLLACSGVQAYDELDGASWVRRHEAISSLFTITTSELYTLDRRHDLFVILIGAPNFPQKRHWPGRLDPRLGHAITRALEEDREWGTTTMRPRLLTWLRSFTSAADTSGAFPGLRVLAGDLHEQLSARWPETVIADYPAPRPARCGAGSGT